MKKFVGWIVLGAALAVGVPPVAAAERGRFYVAEWKPSKSKPSVVRAGIQVKNGAIDRWFVTHRDECTVKGGRPEIDNRNSYALNERNLEIEDGRFEFRWANKWSHAAGRTVFRGRIDQDSGKVEALYRARLRYHGPHADREKCRTGPLRFELERGTSRAFFAGFDPFSDK